MPHLLAKIGLFFRLCLICAVSALLIIQLSGCLDPMDIDFGKRVSIKGNNITGNKNCIDFESEIEIQGEVMAIAENSVVFIFARSAGKWKWVQSIAYDTTYTQVQSIVMTPSLLVVGVGRGIFNIGRVDLYEKINGTWTIFQVFKPDIQADNFGRSLHVAGERMIIGAPGDLVNEFGIIGRAYVYKLENNEWIFESKLQAIDSVFNDHFGTAVHLVGNYALICKNSLDQPIQVFKREGNQWIFHKFLDVKGVKLTGFGNEVMVAGNTLTALTLDPASQEFLTRTIETADENIPGNFFTGSLEKEFRYGFGEKIEMDDGYALVSGYSGKSVLFKLEGNSWVIDRTFDHEARGLAISNEFIALGIRDNNDISIDNKVRLFPR